MKRHRGAWSRSLTGALALIVGLALISPPAAAEEAVSAPAGKRTRPLAEAARAALAKLDTSSAVVTTQQPGEAAGDSKPFFKTTKGIVVLALMVAGTAYTLYSKDKDRVRSPIR